jgi:4-alpha-glucanotransferase
MTGRRRAGLLVPLFSCPSTSSWGVGEIPDLVPVSKWLAGGGQRVLQLLPINEMAPGQHSPYSAITAMAIDPVFVRVSDVPEFAAIGGDAALSETERSTLKEIRGAPCVRYAAVRELKDRALRLSFDRFDAQEWRPFTGRARELQAFVERESWWLDDYGLFRAIRDSQGHRPWAEWPRPLRDREPDQVAAARRTLARDIRFYAYLQWIADTQWQAARRACRNVGVEIFGDLPFMVDGDSADVWSRPHLFRLDVSLGVPPDAFSATGQDWGMPAYDWGAAAADDYSWLRARARRSAALYDGYRVDHLVGFYRTYARPRDGSAPFFSPADEADQTALGEHLLELFRASGAEVIVEDLGTVPDFVRASLARRGVAGFRVFRWERHWQVEGRPFRDPADYPAVSVAASGTHDTEPMAAWWDAIEVDDKAKVAELPTVRRVAPDVDLVAAPYSPIVRDVLLEALFASGSDLLVNVVHDVFGWRERINEPATVDERNWTFRLPWPADGLDEVAQARERQSVLAQWTRRYLREG